MWDLEDYILADNNERNKNRIETEIDYDNFLIELAYHEASHFVFDQLILKMDLGFSPVTRIFVHCSREDKILNGVVTGLGGYEGSSNSFYRGDNSRVYARLLTTLAGYTSRLVFIDDSPFFISEADLDNYTNGKLFYYTIETAPRKISDVRKTKDYIQQYLDFSIAQRDKLINSLIEDIKLLMKTPAMKLAIGYVKNVLVQHNGVEVIGRALEHIKLKIDILSSKIYLEDTISKYL
jgi:hypothetical protein